MDCKLLQKSRLTGRMYDEDKVVFFRNPVQSAYYYLKGAELIDLIPTEELKFVFVFKRSDHKKLIPLWDERKNNQNEQKEV